MHIICPLWWFAPTDAHPDEAAEIAKAGQAFAQQYLTHEGALASLAAAITDGTAWPPPAIPITAEANGSLHVDGDETTELRRGDWASNRGAYDAVRMYYRWTFMPVSKVCCKSAVFAIL